jgi:SOS response regulatory protein OraA/RecX
MQHLYFKALQKDYQIVKGPTDELRVSPSPLLLRLKRIAEDPKSAEDPLSTINREINRIQGLLSKLSPTKGKIERLNEITRKTVEAFEVYLSAWKKLLSSFQENENEEASYIITEDIPEGMKEKDLLSVDDKLITDLSGSFTEDKIEILSLLKDRKFSREELTSQLTTLDFNAGEIDSILNKFGEKDKNKINDPKKLEILNLLKNKIYSKEELVGKLEKMKFTDAEIQLVLRNSKEDSLNNQKKRQESVHLAEEAEKMLVKVEKREQELRRDQAIEL